MSWIASTPSLALALASTGLQTGAVGSAETTTTTPPPEELAQQVPIIVEGSREVPESRVQTGSRISGENRRRETGISTNTGIAGLSPGSGMEPLHPSNPVRKRITTTCVSDNSDVGERASCLLLQAQEDVAAGDTGTAADIYRFLVSSEEFTQEERFFGGIQLHNLAEEIGDEGMREEAIIRLLASGTLPEERAPSARRNLAQMAMARGDMTLAIERLEEHVSISNDDAVSFANLAILRRDAGRKDAATPMQRAIELTEARGENVPQSWRDFVLMESAG